MYCKHDTQADIESKRRMLSEKIEMKRNSANMKRTSSIMPNVTNRGADMIRRLSFDGSPSEQQTLEKQGLNTLTEPDGVK